MIVTRFAPSPTGHLHLGHAYSALFAFEAARRESGKFLLRIEDIDPVRCKPNFIDDLKDDLHWLGLAWEEPVRKQSEHLEDYGKALDELKEIGVVYPCFCTRSQVALEAKAAGHAPHLSAHGPEGPLYPGTCRRLSKAAREEKLAHEAPNWRLDMEKAGALTGPLFWRDRARGTMPVHLRDFGDVVIARKDVPTSYHLSVTVDDHLQGVTLVTRGEDLAPATGIHRLLQELLGFPPPDYHHHPLLKNKEGQRLAKRDNALTLRSFRESGKTADEVRRMAGF
jgi:glutamyl-Q tRNA(Asp) synthetase